MLEYKAYQTAFENEHGDFLDITFYPEERWLSITTDGKKEGFDIGSVEEWNQIDEIIRDFFKK